MPPHHLCETCKLLRLHGPPVQRFEQPHNLGRPKASRKQLFHRSFRLRASEDLPGFGSFDQRNIEDRLGIFVAQYHQNPASGADSREVSMRHLNGLAARQFQ